MRPTNSSLKKACLAVAGFAALATGCSADKLTYDRYQMVQPKQYTQADVRSLLGPPSSQAGGHWIYDRFDKSLNVVITFDGSGRVERKQWVDPGTWDDSAAAPGAERPK